MQTEQCQDNCCQIKINPYKNTKHYFGKGKKAGVFIYDPVQKKILIVQSRGHLWGAPKGSLNVGETIKECAIREVKEETNLDLSKHKFDRYINIKKNFPECLESEYVGHTLLIFQLN